MESDLDVDDDVPDVPARKRYFRRALDVSWLLLSFGLRLAAGIAVLIVLARVLGSEAFGRFAYCLALATIFAVPANFGLGTYVLREIGVDRQRYAPTMGAAVTTKMVFGVLVLLAGVLMSYFLSDDLRLPFTLLLLAQLSDSFAELFNLGFRPGGHYQAEAKTAVIVSMMHLVLMGLTALLPHPNAAAAAGLFCASRMLGGIWTWWQSRRFETPVEPARLSTVPVLVRRTWAYALELFQLTAFVQLDSMFIHYSLGIVEVGLYQAGMKLVEGGARLAPVLAQYALPSLTRQHRPSGSAKAVLQTLAAFGLVGAMGAACLALGSNLIVDVLYGAQYKALKALLPIFGLMLFLRYLETAGGVIVVAAGLQHIKVWFVSLQLALVVALGPWALERWGLQGWQWCSCVGLAITIGTYAVIYLAKSKKQRVAPQRVE